MSAVLMLALLLQVFSVALLRVHLGKTWLRRPGALLVVVSALCQAFPVLLLRLPGIAQWDYGLTGTGPAYVDDAALLTSAAMLAFTLAYLSARPARAAAVTVAPDRAALRMPWLPQALAVVPMAVLTFRGQGLNSLRTTGIDAGTGTELTAALLVILVITSSAGFILRHGHFTAVLAVQSVLLAAAGERTPVLTAAVAVPLLCARAGKRPSRRQACAVVAVGAVAFLAITGLRAEQGRAVFVRNSGFTARAGALATGLFQGTSSDGGAGLTAQLASRLEADSWTAAILQAEHLGYPRLPASGAASSVLLVVPSAVWAGKLSGGSVTPVGTETSHFGLQDINFLPGLPGLYAGFLPAPWLVAFLGFLGLLAGRGDRWLLARVTPARLVMLAGAVMAVADYQAGLPAMLCDLRSAVLVAAGLGLVSVAGRRLEPRQDGARAEYRPSVAGCALQSPHQGVTATGTGVPPR